MVERVFLHAPNAQSAEALSRGVCYARRQGANHGGAAAFASDAPLTVADITQRPGSSTAIRKNGLGSGKGGCVGRRKAIRRLYKGAAAPDVHLWPLTANGDTEERHAPGGGATSPLRWLSWKAFKPSSGW